MLGVGLGVEPEGGRGEGAGEGAGAGAREAFGISGCWLGRGGSIVPFGSMVLLGGTGKPWMMGLIVGLAGTGLRQGRMGFIVGQRGIGSGMGRG